MRSHFRFAITVCLLLQGVAANAAPYVVRSSEGWTKWEVTEAGIVERLLVDNDETVSISSVGELPAFQVRLRPAKSERRLELTWPPLERTFVLADSHGEFEITAELMRSQGVIDSGLNWSFGAGHLVVLGDVFDRGAHHTELLWLFYKLESEAKAHGGAVHLLLGNHEVMVLSGDLRYLHPKYHREAKAFGLTNYAALWSSDTLLGRWLRAKPAVTKIGRTLFLHGGISADVVEAQLTLADINNTIWAWLNDKETSDTRTRDLVLGPTGPLWYRGYFPKYRTGNQGAPREVENAKAWFDCERIAIGHTIVDTVTPLYEGSVIAVQVYPTRDKTNGRMSMEGVYIDGHGTWFKARIDGSRELLKTDHGEPIRSSGRAEGQPSTS